MRFATVCALTLTLAASASAKPRLEVVLSPNGGFAAENRKPIKLMDGTEVPPDLNVKATDMIRSIGPGGRIEIAMYAFSDENALAALIERARAGVAIRMVLDACADWTEALRKEVFDGLKAAKEQADKDKKPFDVQVKTITCETFVDYGRAKKLDGGEEITGTMHEKFGVFFLPKRKVPTNGFCGSSNFAKAASTLYAENRVFFYDDPVSVSQLHEEFQRLWKWWGTCSFGECEEVKWISDTEAGPGQVKMVFNGETRHGGDTGNPKEVPFGAWRRIDGAIERVLERMKPDGSMDFAMFSFTHHGLKDKILELAKKHPKARVRILFDLSMLQDDVPDRPGVLGPGLERDAKKMGIKNVQVRYKWRSNAFACDEDPKKEPGLNHFRSFLLHDKLVMVNRSILANGSYNWSQGAERRNLENVQIFDGADPAQQRVIDHFARDFDALWSAKGPEDASLKDKFRDNPEVGGGDALRALSKRIVTALKLPGAREIMAALDKVPDGKDPAQLAEETKLDEKAIEKTLVALRDVTLLMRRKDGKFALAD